MKNGMCQGTNEAIEDEVKAGPELHQEKTDDKAFGEISPIEAAMIHQGSFSSRQSSCYNNMYHDPQAQPYAPAAKKRSCAIKAIKWISAVSCMSNNDVTQSTGYYVSTEHSNNNPFQRQEQFLPAASCSFQSILFNYF